MKKSMLTLCIAGVLTSQVVADEYPDFEAYLGAAGYVHDDQWNMDDSFSLEGGVELPLNETVSIDAWFSKYDMESENSNAELSARRYNPSLLFHLKDGDYRPFISAGFSHIEFEEDDGTEHSESLLNLAVGVKKYLDSNIVLRGEVLGMNSIDNEWQDFGLRLSAGYAFGRSVSKPVIQEAPASEPVVKSKPAQKVTPTPVVKPAPVVEAVPAPKPVPAPVSKPAPVPVDSDKDGVVDANDKCPGTNEAFKVNEQGCPVMLTETVSIEMNVKFPSNSSVLSQDYYPEIKKVADFMKQFDKTVVTVEGHSDDRGKDEYNKFLSQRRADSVRNALIGKFSVPADRVTAIGYGEEKPIADNATAEGRAKNRRVVAVVKSTIEKAVQK